MLDRFVSGLLHPLIYAAYATRFVCLGSFKKRKGISLVRPRYVLAKEKQIWNITGFALTALIGLNFWDVIAVDFLNKCARARGDAAIAGDATLQPGRTMSGRTR